MPDDPTGPWQSVRRALGRLVSGTRVRELPLTNFVPAPAVVSPPSPAVFVAGAAEPDWRLVAWGAEVTLPLAAAGAGEAPLAPAATVMRLAAAPSPDGVAVRAAALPPLACTTHRLDAFDLRGLSVSSPSVTLLGGGVSNAAVQFAAPDTARLPMEAPSLARGPILRWPGRRAAPDDPLRLDGGRVRPGTGMLAQIPLKRAGRPVPKGVPAADAFAAEWRLLAQKAGVAPEDVLLVGVFPQVPVAAVRRLALEEGALCLWLKPEALAAAAAGKVPRLATLIVGRQRSTGKMIQTAA